MELLNNVSTVAFGVIVFGLLLTLIPRYIVASKAPGNGTVRRQEAMRSEQEVFDELADLCSRPGFIHAIAYFSFRDNMIRYSEEMKAEDMQHMFSRSRLTRTEISTLIGLLVKTDISYTLPTPHVLQTYLDRTEELLDELHRSMSAAFLSHLNPEDQHPEINPVTSGAVLREPIFYGGESAYSFQYRDFSQKKYARDDDWLKAHKGFSIQDARTVTHTVGRMQDEKIIATMEGMREVDPEQWTILPGYTFTANEVARFGGLDLSIVRKVLSAFSLHRNERNSQFNALREFNITNALPLIPVNCETFILFHIYSLVEALYESPFYWMGADTAYAQIAMDHRGRFTEEFSAECMVRVYGNGNVYSNADIFESKKKKAGEIDVLVVFGDRAIVLQAKSKRLTLEARKGNDQQIKDDFKKSVQESCDQAYRCADMLRDPKYTLKDSRSREIRIATPIKEVYVLCVVSDHYPALSFQARQFLNFDARDGISPPFVLDVFTLDAMTEMLESPMQLLSYIDRRTKYSSYLLASHERTILSYHLKQNLWLSGEHDLVFLGDDISIDLDLAMLVRREGIPAEKTPDGILTRFATTTLGRFLTEIERRPEPGTIDLGFLLLTLNEETVIEVSEGIDELARRGQSDGKSHDLTVGLGRGDTGLTVHCNDRPRSIAGPALERHCHMRKYTQHAQTWYGICVTALDKSLRFGLKLEYDWAPDPRMDSLVKTLKNSGKPQVLLKPSAASKGQVGRNAPCPCGSGKKYKYCCLRRES